MEAKMKKILSIILCLGIIFASSAGAFAIEMDYPYNVVSNNGEAVGLAVTVSHPEAEDIYSYAFGGLNHEWQTTNGNRVDKIFLWADENTDIGINSISLVWYNETTQKIGCDTILVDVFDVSKPKIIKTSRNGSSVKIKWNGAKSKYYDIQYRVKNGSWKTAALEYNTEETGMEYTFKNLKKGNTYQFRVRPVTPTYNFGTRPGNWSTAVSVKIK